MLLFGENTSMGGPWLFWSSKQNKSSQEPGALACLICFIRGLFPPMFCYITQLSKSDIMKVCFDLFSLKYCASAAPICSLGMMPTRLKLNLTSRGDLERKWPTEGVHQVTSKACSQRGDIIPSPTKGPWQLHTQHVGLLTSTRVQLA